MTISKRKDTGKTNMGKRAPRVAVFLDHPGDGDSRVINAALALQTSGFDVRIFALHRDGGLNRADTFAHPDLTFIPVQMGPVVKVPRWLAFLARKAVRFVSGNPAAQGMKADGLTSDVPSNPGVTKGRFAERVNRTIGALFWHRGITRAYQAKVLAFSPHLIHAHDLSMLGAGVSLARKVGAKVIYDTHEFEQHRNGVTDTLAERIRRAFEYRLIRKADATVCVSETIADRLSSLYSVQNPVVIPNLSLTARVAPIFSRRDLGLRDDWQVVVYVGSLQEGRGLHKLIEAISYVEGLHLLLAGHAEPSRVDELRAIAVAQGVAERLHYIPPVRPEQVGSLIAMANLSVVPIQPSCESYRLCLPNKLFQSLSAGVPVVSTPLPEVAAVIEHLNGGTIAIDYSVEAFSTALQTQISSPDKVILPLDEYDLSVGNSRYVSIATALINDQPCPSFKRFPHAKNAIRNANLSNMWAQERRNRKSDWKARLLSACAVAFL